MTNTERDVKTARDNRRTGIFWGGAVIMLGIAVLLHFLVPEPFGFWACAGIFLAGTGIIGILLDVTMKNGKGLWFSVLLTIAGFLLIIGNVFGSTVDYLPWILFAVAIILIGLGILLRYIIKKD